MQTISYLDSDGVYKLVNASLFTHAELEEEVRDEEGVELRVYFSNSDRPAILLYQDLKSGVEAMKILQTRLASEQSGDLEKLAERKNSNQSRVTVL